MLEHTQRGRGLRAEGHDDGCGLWVVGCGFGAQMGALRGGGVVRVWAFFHCTLSRAGLARLVATELCYKGGDQVYWGKMRPGVLVQCQKGEASFLMRDSVSRGPGRARGGLCCSTHRCARCSLRCGIR